MLLIRLSFLILITSSSKINYYVTGCLSPAASTQTADGDVLKALSQIIDPDFQTDIVSCGFVKDLHVDEALGEV